MHCTVRARNIHESGLEKIGRERGSELLEADEGRDGGAGDSC